MVLVVSGATDEPCRFGAVNEADGTVVAKEEVVSHFTDRWPPRIAMSAYGQEELVLGGREARSLSLLLAPTFEMAHAGAQGEQSLVDLIGQGHASHDIILPRCNSLLVTRRAQSQSLCPVIGFYVAGERA